MDILDFKKGGLIKERKGNSFSVRLRLPGGQVKAEHLAKLSQVAQRWGDGTVHLTSRQGLEIPGVDMDNLGTVKGELATVGLAPGSCGPRLRNILTCPGNISCSHGLVNSRALGMELDRLFLSREYPVKIKMAVCGCPNSCTTPQTNDIGFVGAAEPVLNSALCTDCGICVDACKEGAIVMKGKVPVRDAKKCIYCGDCIGSCPSSAWTQGKTGYTVYVGGRIGRHPGLGKKLASFVSQEEAPVLVGGILEWVVKNAKDGKRLGILLDETGLAPLKQHLKIA